MQIIATQTTDPEHYRPLFDVTSPSVQRFCALHGLSYAPFIGIKRGDRPWHASFNRIGIFSELVTNGFYGWALYLDADAYVYDIAFDIRTYLAQNQDQAIIGAPGGDEPWNVNSGILLLNFMHAATIEIVGDWRRRFNLLLPDSTLLGTPEWPTGMPDDQSLLHSVLGRRNDCATILKLEPLSFIGQMNSSFLRQLMRNHGTIERRIEIARTDVADALAAVSALHKQEISA